MAGRGRSATLPAWMTSTNITNPVENKSDSSTIDQHEIHSPVGNYVAKTFPPVITQAQPLTNQAHPLINQAQPLTNQAHPLINQAQPLINQVKPIIPQGQHGFNPSFQLPPSMIPQVIPYLPQNNPNTALGQIQSMISQTQYPSYPPNSFPGMGNLPHMNKPLPPVGKPPIGKPHLSLPVQTISNQPIDPNNDITAWSEHETDNGRKYWFNRINLVSTYEKPFCLKSPEERSIPNCSWVEYTSPDGKKYYSNGKESVWTMPEEFKIWKEKIDAIAKKQEAAKLLATIVAASENSSDNFVSGQYIEDVKKSAIVSTPPVVITYNTKEESREAFISLLTEMDISSTMRMKEVQDLCQNDPRWNALRNIGEKKQELAEYQTKKLKVEKEQLKAKAKRARDQFLLMLAENIEIDSKTRWRNAVELLQNDSRFKNVEDSREREDLFNDFVLELEKKDREDRMKKRESANQELSVYFDQLYESKILSRKSDYSDFKDKVSSLLLKPQYQILDESDVRRSFQDYVRKLEESHRSAKRLRIQEHKTDLDRHLNTFQSQLEVFIKDNSILSSSRWKDETIASKIKKFPSFQECESVIEKLEKDYQERDVRQTRDIFEKLMLKFRDCLKSDLKFIKDVIRDCKIEIKPQTSFSDFFEKVLEALNFKKVPNENETSNGYSVFDNASERIVEIESDIFGGGQFGDHASILRNILSRRSFVFNEIFQTLIVEITALQKEEEKKMKRLEDKYVELLEEYFYRSDHVGIQWEDAKRKLEQHSAYEDLSRTDRKRLFQSHMEELERQLEMKTKSMKTRENSGAEKISEIDEAPLSHESDHGNSSDSDSNESKGKKKKRKKEKNSKKNKRRDDDDNTSKRIRKS